MASTLYLLLPSKSTAIESPEWMRRACPFALISDEGAVIQQGQQVFAELTELVKSARQVVLLLAASDVSLMSVNVPPMSAAKLKAALPHLIEDQLLTDSAQLILLSNAPLNGMCIVAAVDRSWMETLHAEMRILGAKKLIAYALSMTMSAKAGVMNVILDSREQVIELAFRHDGKVGAGLTLNRDQNADSAIVQAQQVLQTLSLFAAESPMNISLSTDDINSYQQAANGDSELAQRVQCQLIDWTTRVAGINSDGIDLMSSVSHDNQSSFDWSKWRWPLGLAAAVLLMNLVGLNFQWLTMQREAKGLRDSLGQTYRTSFPKETVILDPLAQMQQKINQSRTLAGQSTPEDFLVLATQFGQVWDAVTAAIQPAPAVISMEYRERSLFVKTKSSAIFPIDQLRLGLKEQNLMLVSSTGGVLQIKSSQGVRK